MNLIVSIVVAWIFYELGEQKAEERTENALLQNSKGAQLARAAGMTVTTTPPTTAVSLPSGSSVSIITGDVTRATSNTP